MMVLPIRVCGSDFHLGVAGQHPETAGVSAVGVLVAGDAARVRLVNNLIVGGFNVNSLTTTEIAVDQTAHAVVVNNIIDGGRGVLSRGLYLIPNALSDDRRVVLLHNDIWGLGQTHPAGNDVADWGVRELNACGWEDCQESGGNFSVDPMRVEPYGADAHRRSSARPAPSFIHSFIHSCQLGGAVNSLGNNAVSGLVGSCRFRERGRARPGG